MKTRIIVALLALFGLIAQPVAAQQSVGGRVVSSSPGYVAGDTRPITLDVNGNLRVISAAAGSGAASDQVQGTAASGTADVGNPVKIGCVFVTTPATVTTGQRVDCQADTYGNQRARLATNIVVGADGVSNNNLGTGVFAGNQASDTYLGIYPYYFNGTGWNRQRDVVGAVAAGTGTGSVAMTPHSAAGGAITPVVTSAVASSLVVKASAGNLYEWRVVAGASAGYVLIFNATSAPADGAVTPVDCIPVAANAGVGSGSTIPERYSTGIVIVFSTTGCFTKTASATAFIRARAM